MALSELVLKCISQLLYIFKVLSKTVIHSGEAANKYSRMGLSSQLITIPLSLTHIHVIQNESL